MDQITGFDVRKGYCYLPSSFSAAVWPDPDDISWSQLAKIRSKAKLSLNEVKNALNQAASGNWPEPDASSSASVVLGKPGAGSRSLAGGI